MKASDFDYCLPQELIAQTPLAERDSSRLLVLDKNSGKIMHKSFTNIVDYLQEGDCLVLNDTKVLPARILGNKQDTGAKIEFLLLKKTSPDVWEVILKPGKKAKVGSCFSFGEGKLSAEILELLDDGKRLVKFSYNGVFEEILDEIGIMPLPPYIVEELNDKNRYQTVYAHNEGSAAAPTAGLHFTNDLLTKIQNMGVNIAYLTLHVGLGTFRPVKTENIKEHKMHSESFSISKDACDKINKAKEDKKKIITVGTTSVRVLETASNAEGLITPMHGETDIFIYPGYRFKCVETLVTNFHLPQSTLVMLVSALASKENILKAYNEAVKQKYRFFSFGDAMLII